MGGGYLAPRGEGTRETAGWSVTYLEVEASMRTHHFPEQLYPLPVRIGHLAGAALGAVVRLVGGAIDARRARPASPAGRPALVTFSPPARSGQERARHRASDDLVRTLRLALMVGLLCAVLGMAVALAAWGFHDVLRHLFGPR
jgi:hypothetical protein